jgi:hypothetical protein
MVLEGLRRGALVFLQTGTCGLPSTVVESLPQKLERAALVACDDGPFWPI